MKIKIITWLIKLLGGGCVSFRYVGERGKKDIRSTSYLHYNMFEDEFIIDWTNKEILLTRRKVKDEKIYKSDI